jgi:hypothetical protein
MSNVNRPGPAEEPSETLRDIKRMMERSSRFISLSGLSGVSAGICALAGVWIALRWVDDYFRNANYDSAYGYLVDERHLLKERLLGLAAAVLVAALVSSTFFTWRKARRSGLPVWDFSSKKLAINMAIPLVVGALFVLALYIRLEWDMLAPACLVFYGLALVNASKYTLTDIRYLGIIEIVLGCVNLYYAQWGIYFWAIGFGVLHIVYGLFMWWKYER